MKLREEIARACEPNRPRKSAAHLFLVPVTFGVAGACCYLLVFAAVEIAVAFRSEIQGFSSYGELSKTVIVLSMLFASFPLGLVASNLVVWSIPPVRRYFDSEAESRAGDGFKRATAGLLLLAKYWSSALISVGAAVALFGR
jgi:hypothetical protein